MTETIFHLLPSYFSPQERLLLESEPLSATTFLYDSGVCGLRIQNELGHLVLLPFQGMQIWSAEFGGRNLTMKSMFDAPHATRTYLENYGGFLLHCGAAAMGVPAKDDTHPLHGELPNAPYQQVTLRLGEDERGRYLAVCGQYQHTVAFGLNYRAEPVVRLYAGSTVFGVDLTVTNLKRSEMEFMYLAHINYRPVDDGRLVYSAVCSPQTVRVRSSIPSHVHPGPGYREFLQELMRHPEKHHLLAPGLAFDPEVVFMIDYLADEDGWAHTMQVHPNGAAGADYVRHRPAQLDKGIRWICRTADQDALGMILPATAEPEGYLAEKAKGNLKVIPAGGQFRCEMEMGVLDAAAAVQMERKIAQMVRSAA